MLSSQRFFMPLIVSMAVLAGCDRSEDDGAEQGSGQAVMSAPAGIALNTAIQTEQETLEWLEDVEGERALEFARSMNTRSLERLTADPRYDGLYSKALEVLQSDERIPMVGVRNGELWNFWRDAEHVNGIWRKTSRESYASDNPEWDVVLDVDALSAAENHNWVWRGADCLAPDYQRCMLTLSDGGSDAAVRREFDLTTRTFVDSGFEIPETKGGTAWIDRDTLLLATALDAGEATSSGYPYVVKRWTRGTPIEQAEVVLKGSESDVGVWPARLEQADGKSYMMAVRAVTFFESEYFLLPEGATADPVQLPLPRKSSPALLFDGQLVFSIQQEWAPAQDAPTYPTGSVLSLDLDAFVATGELPEIETVFTPNERQSTDGIAATREHLLMVINDNVVGGLRAFTHSESGWSSTAVPAPENASLSIVTADEKSDLAYISVEGFLEPESLYRLTADLTLEPAKAGPAWFDTSGYEVIQREVASSDGTLIPYFIVRGKDAEGPQPTRLYAYGGFQVSLTPSYSGTMGRLWLDNGGVHVLANIRGGGEFGPAWHQAGLRTKRQNIYDDLIAVAEDLVASGVTTADQLAVQGGSNGGLLTGVMYTQRPDLWGAVISQVPLLDMLRFHRLLAGASWQDEYGFPDENPEERAFLRSISPLHNVESDVDYPPLFLLTSTKDDRVHPGHARKMAYLLEQLGKDVLYYENIEGGHSAAANLKEAARRIALEYTFMMQELMDR